MYFFHNSEGVMHREAWQEPLKPPHQPAWHPGNLHEVTMSKNQPLLKPKPKDPTHALKDLKPKDAGRVRVFNQAFRQEILQMHEAEAGKENVILPSARAHSSMGGDSMSRRALLDERSTQSDTARHRKETLEATRQRDEAVRTESLAAKMQRMHKTKEDEFQAVYHKLLSEQQSFVGDIDKYLDEKQRAQTQKRRTLYAEWKECVFDKIQDQLLHRLEDLNSEKLAQRNREIFQNYIDAARRKGGRLFLDIVIENEYDPFTWKKDTLKYRDKPALVSNGPGFTDRFGNPVFDPVKRDLEKLKSESKAAQEVGSGSGISSNKLGRETLGHEHWSKMEATPFYDRAAKVQDAILASKNLPVRSGMQSKINFDDYRYPIGESLLTKEFQGLYGRGKRVWQDWQPGGNVYSNPSVADACSSSSDHKIMVTQ